MQTTLSDLEQVESEKQRALQSFDAAALFSLADREDELTLRLANQLQESRARFASDDDSLAIDPVAQRRFEELRARAARLKQQVAIHWLAIYRAHQYVGDMLSIIAQAGRPAATAHFGLMVDQTA